MRVRGPLLLLLLLLALLLLLLLFGPLGRSLRGANRALMALCPLRADRQVGSIVLLTAMCGPCRRIVGLARRMANLNFSLSSIVSATIRSSGVTRKKEQDLLT
jgi:hypothetical protein